LNPGDVWSTDERHEIILHVFAKVVVMVELSGKCWLWTTDHRNANVSIRSIHENVLPTTHLGGIHENYA